MKHVPISGFNPKVQYQVFRPDSFAMSGKFCGSKAFCFIHAVGGPGLVTFWDQRKDFVQEALCEILV